MVDNAIVNYLKEGLRKGYSLSSLKEALLKRGYPSADVNDAIKQISPEPKVGAGKKPIIIAIIIISIIALAVAAVLIYPRIPKPSLVQADKAVVIEYATTSLDDSLEECGTKTNKFYICSALGEDDASICDSVAEIYGVEKLQCTSIYYQSKAIKTKDTSYCEKIPPDFADFCRVMTIGDPALCETAPSAKIDENFVEFCKWYLQPEPFPNDLAADLAQKFTYSYYFIKAMKENDVSVCKDVIDSEEFKFYKGYCDVALTQDLSICDGYKKEMEKEGCKEEQEECCYDLYYEKLAVLTDNTSLCGEIVDVEKKASCLRFIESDVSGKCFGDLDNLYKTGKCFASKIGLPILEEETTDSYYFGHALSNDDKNACQMIKGRGKKLTCIGYLDENPSVCAKLTNIEENYKCFSFLAGINANISLCDEIKDKDFIKECYEDWA